MNGIEIKRIIKLLTRKRKEELKKEKEIKKWKKREEGKIEPVPRMSGMKKNGEGRERTTEFFRFFFFLKEKRGKIKKVER